MKSKTVTISCLTVTAMLVISMNAYAAVADITAWTDKTQYNLGEDVEIYAKWTCTCAGEHIFFHHGAEVYMNITKKPTTEDPFHYRGWWRLGEHPERGGDVYVDAYGPNGEASYTWDSSEGSTGTWFVHVQVHAWDNCTTAGTIYCFGEEDTNDFTLV